MKIFKVLQKIFIFVALGLFLASLVAAAADLEYEAAYVTTGLSMFGVFVLAAVGVFLLFSNNDTAKKVGHGLVISSYAIGLALAIMTMTEQIQIASVLVIIAAIALALYYLCALVIYIMKKSEPASIDNPEEDVRIVRIREWKRIMEEGIISAEEYEEKRQQILDIKTKSKELKPAKAEATAADRK